MKDWTRIIAGFFIAAAAVWSFITSYMGLNAYFLLGFKPGQAQVWAFIINSLIESGKIVFIAFAIYRKFQAIKGLVSRLIIFIGVVLTILSFTISWNGAPRVALNQVAAINDITTEQALTERPDEIRELKKWLRGCVGGGELVNLLLIWLLIAMKDEETKATSKEAAERKAQRDRKEAAEQAAKDKAATEAQRIKDEQAAAELRRLEEIRLENQRKEIEALTQMEANKAKELAQIDEKRKQLAIERKKREEAQRIEREKAAKLIYDGTDYTNNTRRFKNRMNNKKNRKVNDPSVQEQNLIEANKMLELLNNHLKLKKQA